MQKVKAEAKRPFVGCYKCDPNEANYIASEMVEGPDGNLITKKVAYKKVSGSIAFTRSASPSDVEEDALLRKAVPEHEYREKSKLTANRSQIVIPADPPFLMLPMDVAKKWEDLGLVMVIGKSVPASKVNAAA